MRHLLREGERVVAVDLMNLRVRFHDEDETRDFGTAAVSLTTAALYLQPAQDENVVRLPYESIVDVVERAPQTVIRTGAAHYVLAGRSPSPSRPQLDLYSAVASHLKKIEVAQVKVEFDDAGVVLLVLRPLEEDGPPQWVIGVLGDVDLTQQETRRRISNSIDPTLLADHPLPPWPD